MVKVLNGFITMLLGSLINARVSLPEEDPLDRELQSIELSRIMATSHPRPVIFLGYVVTKPLDVRRKSLVQLVWDTLC